MKLKLETVPYSEMPFTTLGTWRYDENQAVITMAEMDDIRYQGAVLAHELVELLYCIAKGITTEECDDFDDFYEREYKLGRISTAREPGFDKNCPYSVGHRWGARLERLVIFITHADFDEYAKACNKVMGISDEQEEEPRDEPDFYKPWWEPEVEATFEAAGFTEDAPKPSGV